MRHHGRLQDRLDAMYVDKLDGRIGEEFYEQRARKWRTEQDNILRDIEAHQGANRSYLDEGIRIIELAKKAHLLYERQAMGERRKLLRFLVSSATWKDGVLTVFAKSGTGFSRP